MIIQRCSPADLVDFLVRIKLTVPSGRYARLLVQVTAGDAWAVYVDPDHSAPIAIAGLFAWPDRESEAWFMVDEQDGPRAITGCLIALRQVLRMQAPNHGKGILARVVPGNLAGERIARFLGFEPAGEGIWRQEWAGLSEVCLEAAARKRRFACASVN